ncbi:MAG: hypothetical protein DA330_10825, partial [Nitrososphaera sp.]|nr:hypothetical protein [Nitrososphaera sp.]
QNAALEQEYVKSTGIQKKMDNMIVESDYAGTGAGSAIVGKKRSTIAMDRAGLKQQIAEAESERRDIMGRLGMYYDAANRLAPELFERYVTAGAGKTLSDLSTIGDDEWGMIKEDLKTGGVELTPEREAGLKKALNALGAQRFDMEQREEYLRLMAERNKIDRASGGSGTGPNQMSRDFMARHREKINRTNETAKRLGLEYNIDLTIPLSAQTTAIESAVSAGKAAMEFLIRGGKMDMTRTAGFIKDIINEYKKSNDPEERDRLAMQLMYEFDRDPSLIKGFDYKGWSIFPWAQEGAEITSGEPGFVMDLVDVWRSAMWFEDSANVNQPAGAESLTFGVNAKTEGRTPMGETEPETESPPMLGPGLRLFSKDIGQFSMQNISSPEKKFQLGDIIRGTVDLYRALSGRRIGGQNAE